MATLLLTALGTAIGGPIGGAVGALIGQQADAMIFGGGSRQGPRLRELSVTTSSYGQPIARNFGRMRVPGSVIWSTDLIESKRKQKGRKGQPSTVTYSYSASFAVALSSTPIARLGRIWADGNLLRGAQDDLKVAGKLRFYQGFGDDPVDPLIAAEKGGNAPGFRDCAYVVFEELELGDFGNRIPALSFEIFAAGGDDSVSLAAMVPAALAQASATIDYARGFADEGGPLAATLSAIDQVIPLVCTTTSETLVITPRTVNPPVIMTLPPQLSLLSRNPEEGRHKQRSGLPAREPAAVRYYDEARDYQPGVQRALGSRRQGRELMVDLPATMTADGARKLANDRANRARWQNETVAWRVAQLDPRIQPGAIVRIPETPGLWFVREWEWFDGGIELALERMPPNLLTSQPSDPGTTNPPTDASLPATVLFAFEAPPEIQSNPAVPRLFAAVSASSNAWRGAALYTVQANSLVSIGSSGSSRATLGTLSLPLAPSQALLFEPEALVQVNLVAQDLDFSNADMDAIAAGANRIMIGGEAVQFARATPLGNGQWELQGLLRGRGGTEAEAAAGHAAGASVVLLDSSLVALDPGEVPALPSTRIAAIGAGDSEPVTADLANAGLSRRPPHPVHPQVQVLPDQTWQIAWTRRARGQWGWDDGVDVPVVEEREAYLAGYGDPAMPHVVWPIDEPRLALSENDRIALLAAWGAADLWVRQVGTFGQSPPLLIASLS